MAVPRFHPEGDASCSEVLGERTDPSQRHNSIRRSGIAEVPWKLEIHSIIGIWKPHPEPDRFLRFSVVAHQECAGRDAQGRIDWGSFGASLEEGAGADRAIPLAWSFLTRLREALDSCTQFWRAKAVGEPKARPGDASVAANAEQIMLLSRRNTAICWRGPKQRWPEKERRKEGPAVRWPVC